MPSSNTFDIINNRQLPVFISNIKHFWLPRKHNKSCNFKDINNFNFKCLLWCYKNIPQLPRLLWGFCPISWKPDFSWTCGFRRYLKDIMYFHLTPFIAKSNETIFLKSEKIIFWSLFPQNGEMRFFLKNRASSLLSIYDPLASCKKLEKTNEPIPRKVRHERTNQQAWIYRSLLLEQGTNNNNNKSKK